MSSKSIPRTSTKLEADTLAIIQKQAEASKKDKQDLAQLQYEVVEYDKSMKKYEESELKLKDIIASKHKELKVQQETFNQAGNPAYDSMIKVEEAMKSKIDQMGKSLEETFLKHIRDNNQLVEEKISHLIKENKSYSESVKGVQLSLETSPEQKESVDLRTIMNEAKNNELVEEADKKRRACNIMLHRVIEPNCDDKNESKKMDEAFVGALFNAVGTNATYKSLSRIGKTDPNKNRPIKLVMKSEEDKS